MELKTWVQTWQHAETALQEVKRRELRAYDYGANLPGLESMLQWAYLHIAPRGYPADWWNNSAGLSSGMRNNPTTWRAYERIV